MHDAGQRFKSRGEVVVFEALGRVPSIYVEGERSGCGSEGERERSTYQTSQMNEEKTLKSSLLLSMLQHVFLCVLRVHGQRIRERGLGKIIECFFVLRYDTICHTSGFVLVFGTCVNARAWDESLTSARRPATDTCEPLLCPRA